MIDDKDTPVKHVVAPIVTLYPLEEQAPAPAPDSGQDETSPTPEAEGTLAAQITQATQAPGDAAVTVPEPTSDEVLAADAMPSADETPSVDKEPSAVNDALPQHDRRVSVMPPLGQQAVIVPMPDEGWTVRIDFWYISRSSRRFVAAVPDIWPDEKLPGLPPLSWHLAAPRRFEQEHSLLLDAGYATDIVRWDADGKPPYEICFSVARPGSEHVILLVTSADYPKQMPAVRVAPMVAVGDDEDVFEKLYAASEPVLMKDLPDWNWDSRRTLIELVWHVEEKLKREDITP